MSKKSFNIAFGFEGKQWVFAPNANFWMLFFASVFSLCWFIAGEVKEYQQVCQRIERLEGHIVGNKSTPEDYDDLEAWGREEEVVLMEEVAMGDSFVSNLFSPSVILSFSAMLSLLVRALVTYLIKVNKIVLLGHSSSEKGLMMHIGSYRVPFRFDRSFWMTVGLSLVLISGSFYYLHANNEKMAEELVQIHEQEAVRKQELLQRQLQKEQEAQAAWEESEKYKQDVVGYFMEHLEQNTHSNEKVLNNYREAFLVKKQMIASQYLIREKASRIDQLSSQSLLAMNKEISDLFTELIIRKQEMPAHVLKYFIDTTAVDKLETALMEQAKYHVPASIKLAQAALETAYGRRVVGNNYFGIKDKTGKVPVMETIEYYNASELKINKHKILSKEKVNKNGKTLYKCRVKDSFMAYSTPWASFRAHSLFLANNKRYHALFTGGKDYRAWAERIGSTKYGGVGYATSPVYGELLKKIIRRYHLDLLDY